MMIWLYAAVAGYFLAAFSKVLDKVLLRAAIPEPIVYAFFTGILSVFILLFAPFGFAPVPVPVFFVAMAAGACVLAALYMLYSALREFDASRVVPLVASFGPFLTLGLSVLLIGEQIGRFELRAFLLLIAGGVLLSWRPHRRLKFSFLLPAKAFGAALFMSASYVLTKLVFTETSFVNGVIWTRLGVFFAALILLLLPHLRRALRTMEPVKTRYTGVFIFNKITGASSLLLVDYAIKKGSPPLVNALGSFEYLFVFLFAVGCSLFMPRLLREDLSARALILKISGACALGASLYFLFQS
jgi:drug/metabolite transporter (DMT)-like permease